MEMHGILYTLSGNVPCVSNSSVGFDCAGIQARWSNASNDFVQSREGQVLTLKAQVLCEREAERLVPIVRTNLMEGSALGGNGTIVYARVIHADDPLFESRVNIYKGVYERGCNVEVTNAPRLAEEIRRRIGMDFFVQNVGSNAIYVGTEPYRQ